MGPMPAGLERLVLTSIYDVSPRFESEVDELLDLLAPHVGERIAMLVVPNHWGDAPIVPGSPFARRLRGWADDGVEIFLHGYFHRDGSGHQAKADRVRARFMTAGEGEFLGLSRAEAEARIIAGRALLEDVIGRHIDGFVAPAWLYGAAAQSSARELPDSNRRKPSARVVARYRNPTCARASDHLGQSDAGPAPFVSPCGEGSAPRAYASSSHRRAPARLPAPGPRPKHQRNFRHGEENSSRRSLFRSSCRLD